MRVLKGVERAAKRLVPVKWRKYFRTSRYQLLMERRAPIDLIVHVGAHFAEDADFYEQCGARIILWIEADPLTCSKLSDKLAHRSGPARHLVECALVSAADGEKHDFFRFNGDGASSSVHHASDAFLSRFPNVRESGEVLSMTSRSLSDILSSHGIDVTAAKRPMLVLDVQGHELPVLQGLGDGLKEFAQCKCEISRIAFYEGGSVFRDVDAHMRSMGFRLASHRYWRVPRHGDVLYVRG